MQHHYENGLKKLKEGKYKEALINFDKALIENPSDATCMSDKAVALFHLDKKEEALALLNHVQELEPANPYRYSSRAFVKDAMGDLQGAILDYKRAIELDPEDMVAYNNLGLIEEKLGYKEAAKKKFAEADALAKKLGINFDENGSFVETKPRQDMPSAANRQAHESEEIEVNKSSTAKERAKKEPLKQKEEELSPKNHLQVLKEVLTSKKVFKEFITFAIKKFNFKN